MQTLQPLRGALVVQAVQNEVVDPLHVADELELREQGQVLQRCQTRRALLAAAEDLVELHKHALAAVPRCVHTTPAMEDDVRGGVRVQAGADADAPRFRLARSRSGSRTKMGWMGDSTSRRPSS